MASSNRTQIRYVAETTWGTTPSSALKNFRDTGDSLVFNISTVQSNEIRSDRQVTDLIQTGASPGGGLNWELIWGNGDDFFESALYNSWSSDLSISVVMASIICAEE